MLIVVSCLFPIFFCSASINMIKHDLPWLWMHRWVLDVILEIPTAASALNLQTLGIQLFHYLKSKFEMIQKTIWIVTLIFKLWVRKVLHGRYQDQCFLLIVSSICMEHCCIPFFDMLNVICIGFRSFVMICNAKLVKMGRTKQCPIFSHISSPAIMWNHFLNCNQRIHYSLWVVYICANHDPKQHQPHQPVISAPCLHYLVGVASWHIPNMSDIKIGVIRLQSACSMDKPCNTYLIWKCKVGVLFCSGKGATNLIFKAPRKHLIPTISIYFCYNCFELSFSRVLSECSHTSSQVIYCYCFISISVK